MARAAVIISMAITDVRFVTDVRSFLAACQPEAGFISEGYSSIAGAVFDHLSQPVAAIGITYRDDSRLPAHREFVVDVVQDSAHKLTQRIGGRNP